jgi:3-oxoacyl-[acyl-carrier protein] reductase
MYKKKILIFGASSDLGQELIKSLIKKNDILIVGQYNKNSDFYKNYKNYKNIYLIKSNLKDKASCKTLCNKIIKKISKIDSVIFFNGKISSTKIWTKITEKEMNKDLQINFLSVLFSMQCLHSYLNKNGKVVFLSTSSATHGGGDSSFVYGWAKLSLLYLTKSFSKYFAKKKITVNSISPGFINTKFHKNNKKKWSLKNNKKRAEFNLLKKSGTPEQIAQVINLMILSDSNFINAQNIKIDGGEYV